MEKTMQESYGLFVSLLRFGFPATVSDRLALGTNVSWTISLGADGVNLYW